MFGIINFEVFLLSGILLNLTPGADTMYILGRSVSQGRKAGILSVFGISTGAVIHTLLASLGLSVILAKSLIAFNIIKYAGAAYLIYLGLKTLFSPSGQFSVDEGNKDNMLKVYLQGILTNVLNPKVALFFLAFLPQFVDPANSLGPLPFLMLGLTFITTGTIWCLLIAIFSSFATNKLRNNQLTTNIMNKLTGILFIGLGLNIMRAKAAN
ncbi:MAG: LysE family translocator [Bacillota bacterium]